MDVDAKTKVIIGVILFFMIVGGLGTPLGTAFACIAAISILPSWIQNFFSSGGLVALLFGIGLFYVAYKAFTGWGK